VKQLFDKHDAEKQLFLTKKIRIVGEKDEESLNKINEMLKVIGFNLDNVVQGENTREGDNYDLVFINNTDGTYYPKNATEEQQKPLLELLKKQSPKVCYFYYCESGVQLDNKNLAKTLSDPTLPTRINFATNPAQIYSNLLNTLKLQEKLSQKN
jgi:hypothetical protein